MIVLGLRITPVRAPVAATERLAEVNLPAPVLHCLIACSADEQEGEALPAVALAQQPQDPSLKLCHFPVSIGSFSSALHSAHEP